jgi:hypothetical protein
LKTVNICGRHCILRADVTRLNSALLLGEFAKPPKRHREADNTPGN